MTRNFKALIVYVCLSLWASALSAQGHWTFDYRQFRYDMTVYFSLQNGDNPVANLSDYEVAAFVGNECRGVAVFEKQTGQNGTEVQYGFLKIYSNKAEGESVVLKCFYKDVAKERDFTDVIPFVSDSYVSYPSNPLPLKLEFQVDVQSAFADMGTVEGGGIKQSGSSATITAIPNEGYKFVRWSDGNTGNPYKFTVNKDVLLTAEFAAKEYIMTFVLDNGQDNIVMKQDYKTMVTAPAEPEKLGFTFNGWNYQVPTTMPARDTTFTAQWTRNSYNLKFMNGDKVISEATVLYGDPITKPANPTKEGYVFTGWSPSVDITMPAHDQEYTAQFSINRNTVTFLSDGKSVKSDSLDYGAPIVAPADPVKTGYTFIGWQPKVPETMPDSSMTFTAKFEINTHQVTWNIDGQSLVVPVVYNATITQPADTVKTGYTFTGWDAAIPELMPDSNLTFNGHFVVNKYLVTFDIDGVIKQDSLDYDAPITVTKPVKEGYTFTGWSPALPDGTTVPAKDVTYTAQFTINKYNVTFMSNGQIVKSETLDYGSEIVAPADPIVPGNNFLGWTPVVDATVPANDVTYTASFEIKMNYATFIVDGVVEKSENLGYGSPIVAPDDPVKTGYAFKGWQPEVPETMPDSSMTFMAKFEINSYQVTWNIDGRILVDSVVYNTAITQPADTAKTGYRFNGWDAVIPETMPAGDLSFTALFAVNKYQVKFIIDEGTYQANSLDYGAVITKPADPTKVGYTFTGWNPALPDGATVPANDVTYTAQFKINQHHVTFVSNDSIVKSEDLTYGSLIVAPADTVKTGYTFKGWQPAIPEEMPDSNMTFTAKFEINTYQVTWNVDGKSYVDSVAYNKAITKPADPTKEGYTFVDWDAAIPELMPDGDLTFEALFAINKYQVTFIVDEEIKADSLDYGATITKPADPIKEGYTFTGWSPTVLATVPARDVTYTAQFTVNQYAVTFLVGTDTLSTTKQDFGSDIIEPNAPKKTGFTFKDWDPEVPATLPSHDVTFTALYERNRYLAIFVIDGDTLQADSVAYEAEIQIPADTVKTGYTFSGWQPEVLDSMPANDVTFTAHWTVNKYNVIYIVNDQEWARDEVAYGDSIVLREYASDERYTFNGWVSNDEQVYTTMPDHNVTYTADITDGIATLFRNAEYVDIYTITGKLVGRNLTVKQMKQLPRGLYIVNGKRILVK